MQYYIPVPEMESNVLTLVAISLPLSWVRAASALHNQSNSASDSTERRKLLNPFSSSGTDTSRRWSVFKHPSPTVTQINGASGPNSTAAVPDRRYPDVKAGKGIGVQHNFSVTNSKCREVLGA